MAGRPKTDLPPEIQLFHILPRLPAKSLFRFMCVSKQWHSFIKSPEFVKMHLRHVTDGGNHHSHHKLLLLSLRSTPLNFSTIDCEALEDGLGVSRSFPFNIGKYMRILASFHGLVCLGIYMKRRAHNYRDIVLWNPLTGDHKTLSKGSSHQEYYCNIGGSFGLYYTSSDYDYKLLRVTKSYDAYIYSLKSDVWRKLEQTCTDDVERKLHGFWNTCATQNTVVLNDKLYMLKDGWNRHSFIRFDIKTEKFKELKTPSIIIEHHLCTGWSFIMVLKGCIYLFVIFLAFKELWRMDGDDERWTKVGSPHKFLPTLYVDEPEPFQTLVRDGNRFINSIEASSLCEQDRKMLVNKVMCSFAYGNSLHNNNITKMIDFTGTLVSPNRYINQLDQDLLV